MSCSEISSSSNSSLISSDSSTNSDITEPSSPCSTSSDEGVASLSRGSAVSPQPSLVCKLAPNTGTSSGAQNVTRPQWPWTPPLAVTACTTYKRLKAEPETGSLPRQAADPSPTRNLQSGKGNSRTVTQHNQESQGKITEYFKTQIKSQQPKVNYNIKQLID